MRGIPLSFGCFASIRLFIFCSRKDVYSSVIQLHLKTNCRCLYSLANLQKPPNFESSLPPQWHSKPHVSESQGQRLTWQLLDVNCFVNMHQRFGVLVQMQFKCCIPISAHTTCSCTVYQQETDLGFWKREFITWEVH